MCDNRTRRRRFDAMFRASISNFPPVFYLHARSEIIWYRLSDSSAIILQVLFLRCGQWGTIDFFYEIKRHEFARSEIVDILAVGQQRIWSTDTTDFAVFNSGNHVVCALSRVSAEIWRRPGALSVWWWLLLLTKVGLELLRGERSENHFKRGRRCSKKIKRETCHWSLSLRETLSTYSLCALRKVTWNEKGGEGQQMSRPSTTQPDQNLSVTVRSF